MPLECLQMTMHTRGRSVSHMTNNVANRWSVPTDLQLDPDELQDLLLTLRKWPQRRMNRVGTGLFCIHGPVHVLRLDYYSIVCIRVYT